MNARPKKKMCWNCEGSVSLKVENCPYCGVSLVPSSIPGVNDHGSATIAPPYRLNGKSTSIPLSPYSSKQESEEEVEDNIVENPEEDSPILDEVRRTALTVFSFISGSVILLFGLALYLFSSGGTLTLKWSASYWYIYALSGLALGVVGWRLLGTLEEPTAETVEEINQDAR